MHILYVEEDSSITDAIKSAYQEILQITCIGTLADAVELIENNSFDVLLVDLNLPDSKGFDTVNSLLKYDLPIIVTTEGPTEEMINKSVELGVFDYISKKNLFRVNLLRRVEFTYLKFQKLKTCKKFLFDGIDGVKKYINCSDKLKDK